MLLLTLAPKTKRIAEMTKPAAVMDATGFKKRLSIA